MVRQDGPVRVLVEYHSNHGFLWSDQENAFTTIINPLEIIGGVVVVKWHVIHSC